MSPFFSRCARFVRKRLLRQEWEKSYSLDGEDRILYNIFGAKRNGFYVDVGACHPKKYSNSYLFYEIGWHGIVIDPMPGTKKRFAAARGRDTVYELGIGERDGTLTYHIFDQPEFNTFNAHALPAFAARGFPNLVRKVDVPLRRLEDILAECAGNQPIDFVSIDVEGFDLTVLQSNDWNKYRAKVIVAEIDPDRQEVKEFLAKNDYRLLARTPFSTFFEDARSPS